MTVASTTQRVSYDGDGVTRDWPVTFTVSGITSDEILVYKIDSDGDATLITSNYEVDLDTPKVTYPTVASGLDPLTASEGVILLRTLDYKQEIDYKNQGSLPAETIEDGFDRLTYMIQQLAEEVNRSVKAPVTETEAPDYAELLADAASEAAGYLADTQVSAAAAAASAAEAAVSASDASLSTYAASAVASASAAAVSMASASTYADNASASADAAAVSAAAAAASADSIDLSEPDPIGDTTPNAGKFTTLEATTSLKLASGATVTGIADEDDMVSDSAAYLATQKSIKKYIDDHKGVGIQIFTSSGTFTTNANTTKVWVYAVGGGGGGGRYTATSGGGGGGGGGTFASTQPYLVSASTGYSVVVGSGGAGATSSNGGTGAASTFDTVISAPGGQGGQSSTGGTGGSAGSSTINNGSNNVVGTGGAGGGIGVAGTGQAGGNGGTSSGSAGGGGGGGSSIGAGAAGGSTGNPGSSAAANSGGGGGGGALNQNGGAGGSGIVIVIY